MNKLNQSGSHVVALAVGVLVVAVIAFGGYQVSQHSTAKPVASTTTASSSAPATIKTKADLSQTAKSLDASTADINSSVNGDALNTDLSDLQ